MKSDFVCRYCGLSVSYWGRKDGGYWKHQSGWHSPPSCGQPAVPITRKTYELAVALLPPRRQQPDAP